MTELESIELLISEHCRLKTRIGTVAAASAADLQAARAWISLPSARHMPLQSTNFSHAQAYNSAVVYMAF